MTRVEAIRDRQSLLDRAKAVPRKPYEPCLATDEEIEVSIAWLKGVVTDRQVAKVRGCTPANVRSFVTATLRRAIAMGKVRLEATSDDPV